MLSSQRPARPEPYRGAPGRDTPRRAAWYNPELRIGEAERAEVADRLASHYSEGRLDDAEFGERLDQAMTAKTAAELGGLLADLPQTAPSPVPVPVADGSRRHQRRMLRVQYERERERLRHERREHRQAARQPLWHLLRLVLLLGALIAVAATFAHTMMHSVAGWVVLGLVAIAWIGFHGRGYRGR
jgi:hypothetical protein